MLFRSLLSSLLKCTCSILLILYSLVTPDLSGAGGEAVVCSLGVSGGSSLCWQQSSGAGVDRRTFANRVSASSSHTLYHYMWNKKSQYVDASSAPVLWCVLYFKMHDNISQLLSSSISDSLGKEVITRLDTSVKTSEYFYTDSNGREVLQRKYCAVEYI